MADLFRGIAFSHSGGSGGSTGGVDIGAEMRGQMRESRRSGHGTTRTGRSEIRCESAHDVHLEAPRLENG